MSKPVIYYFKVLGKGQFLFALLNYLNIDFEHKSFTGSIPPEVKQQCKFGQVPLYIDDDVTLCQTHAISRYICNKNNFNGRTLIETAKCDEIIDSFWDCLNPVFKATYFGDELKLEEFKSNNKIATFLNVYEKQLNDNKYIAGGNDYTYADLGVYVLFNFVRHLGYVSDVTIYPKLIQLKSHFDSLPQMKAYLDRLNNQPK